MESSNSDTVNQLGIAAEHGAELCLCKWFSDFGESRKDFLPLRKQSVNRKIGTKHHALRAKKIDSMQ